MTARLILSLHASATLFMTGVIWFVQVVHYPLFASVGRDGFVDFEARHTALTTWVVAPAMLFELVCAVLLIRFKPAAVSGRLIWIGLMLIAIVWLSTAFIQVPCHRALADGFDADVHQHLVQTNWIRTIAWTLRTGLVVWMVMSIQPDQNSGGPFRR